MITTHLITQNDAQHLERALVSLQSLKGEIIVADIASTDDTTAIAENYGCKIYKVEDGNRAVLRNRVVAATKTDWQFYIEPWETLDGELKTESDISYLNIVSGSIITKEARLWKKSSNIKFVNPVYEHLDVDDAPVLEAKIYSGGRKSSTSALLRWKETEPTATAPLYYQACEKLATQKYEEFLAVANHFLFLERKATKPVMLTKYYCSLVHCQVTKDTKAALQHILECLAVKPLMAEFWCALGDIYYSRLKDYSKAHQFYENAILLGSKRPADLWPTDISKYKKYPEQMIDSCRKIRQQSTWIQASPTVRR